MRLSSDVPIFILVYSHSLSTVCVFFDTFSANDPWLIFYVVDGNYPKRVLDTIPASILRRFTEKEKKIIKGSADFYAIGPIFFAHFLQCTMLDNMFPDSYATIVTKTPPNGIEACASNVDDPNWPSRSSDCHIPAATGPTVLLISLSGYQ